MKTISPISAMLAAKYAQELGLPPGNMWEPPMARAIERMMRHQSAEEADRDCRAMLGLDDE